MGKIPGKPAAGGGSSAKKKDSSCESDRKHREHLRKFEEDSKKKRRDWINLTGDSASSSQPLTSSSQTPGKLSGESQRKSSSASCASGRNSADSTTRELARLDMSADKEDPSCSSSQQMPSIGLMPTLSGAGNRHCVEMTLLEQGGASASTDAKGLSKAAAVSSQQKGAGSKGETSSKGRGKSKRYDRSGSSKEGAGKPKGRRDHASQSSQKRLCRSKEEPRPQVAGEPAVEVEGDVVKSSEDEARREKNQNAIDKYKQQEPYLCWRKFVPEAERPFGQSCSGVPGTPDPKLKMSKRTWEKAFHKWQQQVERYVDVETVKRSRPYQWLRQQRESGREISNAPGTPKIEHFQDNAKVRQWKALFAEWKNRIEGKFLALSTQSEAFTRLGSGSVTLASPPIHHLLPDWPPRERAPDP
eukprot:TRINITY_DN34115_c0_g1_i1.p1 TRINITY_DN34115_c0_g1~~TRINITY_DN34115_c0_g1_i1.p1  ORF type:complete len:415 (-),score=78.16 TRINITY_DN34115_c0_g1_i1:387-1631(-)